MSPRSLDADVITLRLQEMTRLSRHLETLGAPDTARLWAEPTERYAVEWILTQLVVQAVDINSHVGRAVAGLVPRDFTDSFDVVAQVISLPAALVAELKLTTGMRNVLVHQYVDLDLERVAAAIPRAHEIFPAYVRAVAGWLAERTDQ